MELLNIDGRSALRFERRLPHPPEKVWRAITEPAHLAAWFPAAVQLELRLGAEVRFDFGDGSGPTPDGVITALDPPRAFGFSWGSDLLFFELHADGAGCRLVFTHTFDDRAGAASFASGWQVCLDALEAMLDGRPIGATGDMAGLHEAYVAALGLADGVAEANPEGWCVRFERQLTRPAALVWSILTASPHRPAPVIGGPVPPGFTTAQLAAGAVTAVETPALLEYEWLFAGRPVGRVRWQLGQGTGHGVRLVLTQTGPAELAGEQTAALAAWRDHIERFAGDLLGHAAPV
ncbi:MAG TPA: SRPBCC family protein [Roseiflexaceae bacterium]|nr:SRPBCC family protein [Roseiflexaceae bacterium]